MERKVFKLHDEFIVQITKTLQLAMLTGTNVVDHFRQMRLEEKEDSGALIATPEYDKYFQDNIVKLLDDAQKLMSETESDDTETVSTKN